MMLIAKPWLWLPAKVAHDLSPYYLQARSFIKSPIIYEWRPFEWKGLRFANRLGLAGGFDKDGRSIRAWWTFGPGFLEIGTVTPQPQGPNPGKIMARDLRQTALWNKMGFPSVGQDRVAEYLGKILRPYHTPLFINIGKNRHTDNARACDDYISCLRRLNEHADAFVINISSPNTAGLRELLQPTNLQMFLQPIVEARDALCATNGTLDSSTFGKAKKTPLLLKLSPDLNESDLASALDVSCALGIDGWIVSNTTLQRQQDSFFPQEGGVSGGPLAPISRRLLQTTLLLLGDRRKGKLVVSTGGVMSAADVHDRLELGADLVQVYSALIFKGPQFFRQVASELSDC